MSLSNKTLSFFLHLGLFVIIEIIFIFLLFREFPETNLLTLIGILHTTYWGILLIAGWIRSKRAKTVRQRFLATYLPVLYHVFTHVYATIFAVREHPGQTYYDNELTRIIIGSISIGILIFWGEQLLNKKYHCDHHHQSVHQHCTEE